MRQLKVIVNDPASLSIAESGGYVTANFVSPVEVKKGSLICLDKFNATSKNISQNFGVVSQTFTVVVNAVATGLEVPITVPAGVYPTINAYMAAINNISNAGAISAYRELPAGVVFNTNNWLNTQSQISMALTMGTAGTGGIFTKWLSLIYGLSQLSTTPSLDWVPSANFDNLFVIDDAGAPTEILNSQTLFPNAYTASTGTPKFTLLQKAGNFGFSYCDDITNDNAPVTLYCITGAYAGKMGTWTYAERYTAAATILGGVAPFGAITYTPQFAVTLGFQPAVYIFNPPVAATTSLIQGPAPFNINQLRSAFELAIEILDIPLKTYFAQTGANSRSYGRQNVICYFTPNPSNETEGLYSFANAAHQWLEIDNLSDQIIQSLSFRIFNSYTGQSFVSNSMGFNLLIKDRDEVNTF